MPIEKAIQNISPQAKRGLKAGFNVFVWLMRNEQLFATLITMGIIFVLHPVAMAQTGTTPITVWDRSDTDLQRGVLNIVRLAKWLMIAGGVVAICWGISKMWTRKPFMIELVGGALSLAAGVLIAFSDSIFKRDIDTPDFLGR